MNINIIVAYCKNRGIGINNKLPWNYPEDLKQFAKITKGNGNNAAIMGRKTYESIGRQLPRRYNIILSRNKIFNGSATQTVKSLENAIEICKERNRERDKQRHRDRERHGDRERTREGEK